MNNNKTTIIIPNRFIRKSFLSFSNEPIWVKVYFVELTLNRFLLLFPSNTRIC